MLLGTLLFPFQPAADGGLIHLQILCRLVGGAETVVSHFHQIAFQLMLGFFQRHQLGADEGGHGAVQRLYDGRKQRDQRCQHPDG